MLHAVCPAALLCLQDCNVSSGFLHRRKYQILFLTPDIWITQHEERYQHWVERNGYLDGYWLVMPSIIQRVCRVEHGTF